MAYSIAHNDLIERITELAEGTGSDASRRLTKEMLKTLPSLQKLIPKAHKAIVDAILRQ
jgi:hypothetical protein